MTEKQIKKESFKYVHETLKSLKKDIGNEYRASDFDERPSMQVTFAISHNGLNITYQTGDNSFTGPCYGLPYWAVVSLYRNSNCKKLADEVFDQLFEQLFAL